MVVEVDNMEPYFIWNGIDSRNMGIWIQQYPAIARPPMRYESISIPGRAGALAVLEDEDVYDQYVREVKILTKPDADCAAILRWLTGKGTVIFGCEPYRAQDAHVYDSVSLGHGEYNKARSATVRFLCDPFKRAALSEEVIDLTEQDTFSRGFVHVYSRDKTDVRTWPLFELAGTGVVQLQHGTLKLAVEGLASSLVCYIDCWQKIAYMMDMNDYKDIVTPTGIVRKYKTFPAITHGDYFPLDKDSINRIDLTGSITTLKITPRWRWF